MTPPPCIHGLTIRKSAKPVNARMVEIPQSHAEAHHFPTKTKVVIALESDPTIRMQGKVWGGKRRYITIHRKREGSNHFLVGTDVSVTPEVD